MPDVIQTLSVLILCHGDIRCVLLSAAVLRIQCALRGANNVYCPHCWSRELMLYEHYFDTSEGTNNWHHYRNFNVIDRLGIACSLVVMYQLE